MLPVFFLSGTCVLLWVWDWQQFPRAPTCYLNYFCLCVWSVTLKLRCCATLQFEMISRFSNLAKLSFSPSLFLWCSHCLLPRFYSPSITPTYCTNTHWQMKTGFSGAAKLHSSSANHSDTACCELNCSIVVSKLPSPWPLSFSCSVMHHSSLSLIPSMRQSTDLNVSRGL